MKYGVYISVSVKPVAELQSSLEITDAVIQKKSVCAFIT
jgi:hypothetical protein